MSRRSEAIEEAQYLAATQGGEVEDHLDEIYRHSSNGKTKWSYASGEVRGGNVVAEYIYSNEDGEPYLRVQRTNNKQFPQSHWDGKKWQWGKPKGPKIPYFLPDLIATAPETPIIIAEGEKDAERVIDLGLVATCASEGAGKWTGDLNKWFSGRQKIYVLADNDEPGRRHAQKVAQNLTDIVDEIRIVALPGLAEHGDVSEWIAAGGTKEKLLELCAAAPIYEANNTERRAEQIARNIEIGDDVTEPIFPAIMTLAEMHDRLVFVGSSGAVVDCATGRIRKKETAADEYAASRHYYEDKDRKPKALKFWIASRKRVTVDVLAWVPGAPEICRPPEATDGAATAFNSWRGIAPMDAPEDWEARATPFLDHVAFLVPNQDERRLYLQWLAHIVQRPEVLPHTAYLMTTQTTGIGRNLMASIIVRALRGHVAAGVSLPELLDGGFTGRLSRKLLAIVDEAREGSGERRYQRAERLKSLITEAHRHVNHKYGLQSVEKNCCRWLMFSNHRDAIPFDNSDRRIHVIENPTVRKEPEYYERLFGLLDDTSFIASVWRRLETLDIASFRPGAHATLNQAKRNALCEMMSDPERAVSEFKEDCETELTSRTIIRDHINWAISGTVNENHLTHAITRAGMVSTGRRVKIADSQGRIIRHSIVIVRGDWTPESVAAVSVEVLTKILWSKDK